MALLALAFEDQRLGWGAIALLAGIAPDSSPRAAGGHTVYGLSRVIFLSVADNLSPSNPSMRIALVRRRVTRLTRPSDDSH